MSALALLAAASLASCSRPRPTGVAAVLTADVAQQLPRELMAFVDQLPAEISGFGFLDFSGPADQLLDVGTEYQPMVNDLLEMTQRRWGVDLRKTRGVGVAALGEQVVFFSELGAAVSIPPGKDYVAARMGTFTVVGPGPAVQAMRSAAQGKLVKQRPDWVRSALSRAAGQLAFYSVPADKLPPPSNPKNNEVQAALVHGTVTVSATGGAVYLTAKPGQVAALRKPLDEGLDFARAGLEQFLGAPSGGDLMSSLQRLAARHWGAALLASVQVNAAGDDLTVALPWHAPVMPAASPAPALSDRIVTPDEWAVVQLDLGRPLVAGLVSVTDVLGTALAREPLTAELVAELSRALQLPALDPRGATVSVGGMSALVSVHGAKGAVPAGTFQAAGGQLLGAATPWGYVVTVPNMSSALNEALDQPAQGMPMAQSSRLGSQRDAQFRAVVDLGRLPTMLKIMARDVPIESVEMAATSTRFEAEVVAKAGAVGQVQQLLAGLTSQFSGMLGTTYQDRKKLAPEDELRAIVLHNQVQIVTQMLTPKVQGDRMTFSYSMSPKAFRAMWAGAAAGLLTFGTGQAMIQQPQLAK